MAQQAPVTPAMIKDLRERTGVGMGKCKEALEEANGDMELAISNLRKAGMATAVKKSGRETKEGKIGISENDKVIALVELNAETDFVVRNDRFQRLVSDISEEVAKTRPPAVEAFLQQKYSKEPTLTVDAYRSLEIQAIGENIQIRRLRTFAKSANKSIGVYSHMDGKIVCVVEISGSDSEQALAKDIAIHVAFTAPEYLSPDKVPAEIVAQEREIAKGQIQGKPANIVDKIVDGKVNAFYDTNCLIKQKYIKDDSVTITDLLQKRSKETGKTLTLTDFLRWQVGA